MDLHWHVLHAATFRGADRDFWEGSVPLQILSASTRALCPTDALLHLLVHGDEADPVPGIRWIADAHMLLRKQPMDWRRLVRIAVDLRVTVPAARTLAFLRQNFVPEIPPDVPREPEPAPVDAREQKLFDFLAGRALLNRLETLGYIFEWHRRATRDLPPWRSAALLPRQFQCYWHLPSMTRIPAHLLKLAVRKPTPTPLVHPPDFVRE